MTKGNTSVKAETIIIYSVGESKTPSNSNISGFLHAQSAKYLDETGSDLSNLEANNKFINLLSNIKQQYEVLNEQYSEFSFSLIKKAFSKTCAALLEFEPDKISVELSYNKSIVFTFKKVEFTFFFEYFLDNSEGDEVIYSSYYKSKKLPSFAGNLELAITTLEMDLNPNYKYLESPPINELSY